MGRKKIIVDKKTLEDLYWKKHSSPAKIAKRYYCSAMTIRTRIQELAIPKRSSSGARMRYKKFDFSGNLVEKAYLIGFRLGDLNTYKTSRKSELVVARCNTTQEAQINLIKGIFGKYGKVTISSGEYSTNVNCFLNKTFNFLLPKFKTIPSWIEKSKNTGLAFIAGYTDAEGNFILNQGRARFKIDAYDLSVLSWIVNYLNKLGIQVKFCCIAREGDLRSNGLKFNADLWRINVNEAFSLLTFITLLKPYIKHKKRLSDMLICEKNIKRRLKYGTIRHKTS